MGVFRKTAASDLAICEGVPAMVAVLSEAGSIELATRGFVDRFDVRDGSSSLCLHEVEMITAGQTDRLTVLLDDLEASLAAVLDRYGRRMAVLTIPTVQDGTDVEPLSPLLEEPLDESPAIVWLKDLDGRYLRVNSRYLEQLGTDAEQVCNRTDAELTAAGSIEGLRLEEKDIAAREPLELEYLIGAFEERPAFVALRFALRSGEGQPTGTCSVAAPIAEASLARSECDRLMRIDRWGRLDASAIRQELLEEWGLTLADGSAGLLLNRDDRIAAALVERDEALARTFRLEEEQSNQQDQALATASQLAEELSKERDQALAAASQLEDKLSQEREQASRLEQELSKQRDEALATTSQLAEELSKERDQALTTASQLEAELATVRDQASRLEEEQSKERDEALSTASRLEQELSRERDQALAAASQLEDELSQEREQAARLEEELSRQRDEASRLEEELTKERDQALDTASQLEAELANGQDRALATTSQLEDELSQARSQAGRLEEDLSRERDEISRREEELSKQRDQALAAASQLEEELSKERDERGTLRAESERAACRADELDGAVSAEQARSDEFQRSLARAEAHVSELEAELTAVRAELEEHLVAPKAPDAASSTPESNGPKWATDSQRALSAALVGLTEWRSVLERAVATIGSEGGWDAAIAWCPDKPRGSMRCGAIWMRDPAGLGTFETRTWQAVEDAATAEFGRARNRMAPTCLLDLQSAEDPLLRAAAAEGMGTALLVPVGDSAEMIAMIELFSRTASAPDPELMVSLESIAMQLGVISQALTIADMPRWRMGRL